MGANIHDFIRFYDTISKPFLQQNSNTSISTLTTNPIKLDLITSQPSITLSSPFCFLQTTHIYLSSKHNITNLSRLPRHRTNIPCGQPNLMTSSWSIRQIAIINAVNHWPWFIGNQGGANTFTLSFFREEVKIPTRCTGLHLARILMTPSWIFCSKVLRRMPFLTQPGSQY